MEIEALQRRLGSWAAGLMAVGMLTGLYVAAAMTGKVPADGRMAVSAHLNAVIGSLWMIAVAWSLPLLRYGPVGLSRLAWAVTLSNVANWALTCVKAWWKVSGIDATGEAHNDAIFGALTALVVLPAFVAAGGWAWGFAKKPLSR
jgi:hydroxylaminobenzene mutase